MSPAETSGMQNHRIAGIVLTAAGMVAFWMALDYPRGTASEPGPAYYPLILSVTLCVLGVLVAACGGPSKRLELSTFWERGRPLAVLGALVVAASIVEWAGFRLTLAALLLFLLAGVERLNWIIVIAIAIALPAGAFLLLHDVLKINLPLGPFGL